MFPWELIAMSTIVKKKKKFRKKTFKQTIHASQKKDYKASSPNIESA